MAVRQKRSGGGVILILLATISTLAGIFIYGAAAWRSDASARDEATRRAVATAAGELATFVEPAVGEAVQLAHLIGVARGMGSGRDIIRGLAAQSLSLGPEFMGVGVVFEADGFDGRDAEFAGQVPENDGDGRFAAYYYQASNQTIETAALNIAELADAQSWYDAPLKSGLPSLLLPFQYPIDGVNKSLSTISVPTFADGKAFGVVIIDFLLTDMIAKVQSLKTAGIDHAWVVSADGAWVIHPDQARVGKTLALYNAGPEGEIEALRRSYYGKKSTVPAFRDAQNGTRYFLMPIPIDGVEPSWFLAVSVPKLAFWDQAPKEIPKLAGITAAILFIATIALRQLLLKGRGRMQPAKSAGKTVSGAKTNPARKSPAPRSTHRPTVERR